MKDVKVSNDFHMKKEMTPAQSVSGPKAEPLLLWDLFGWFTCLCFGGGGGNGAELVLWMEHRLSVTPSRHFPLSSPQSPCGCIL